MLPEGVSAAVAFLALVGTVLAVDLAVAAGSDTVSHLLDRFLTRAQVTDTLAHTSDASPVVAQVALLACSSCFCSSNALLPTR